MKLRKLISFLFLLALVFLTVGAIAAHADTTNSLSSGLDGSTLSPNIPDATTVTALLKSVLPPGVYSVITNILLILGAFRLVVKPAIAAVHSYADATETPKDNELITKIENSPALKWTYFVLDWAFSYKVRK